MASAADELLDFVSASARPDLRRTTLHFLLGLSAGDDTALFQQNEFGLTHRLCTLLRDLGEAEKDMAMVLSILVNLSASALIATHLLQEQCLISFITSYFHMDSKFCVPVSKIVSNLTAQDGWCEHVVKLMNLPLFCESVINALNDSGSNESTVYFGYVLRNLTRIEQVRKELVKKCEGEEGGGKCLLSSLFPLIKMLTGCDKQRKLIAIDIIRNCCFDTNVQSELMPNEDLLVALLYPLIGGEELEEHETDALPLDLQYMDTHKQREPTGAVRIAILETLYQLCATSVAREYIRDNGAYFVLREYHKWEPEAQAELLIGNIIGVLIRTEDEIGVPDLKQLHIKEDLNALD